MRSSARPLLSGVCALLLQGCHGLPTRLYAPYTVPPSMPPAAYDGPAVKVEAMHLPAALNRTELVSNLSTGRVRIDDLAYWSVPLRESAPRIFSADLMQRLPQGKVIFPSLVKPDGALGISIDVLQFSVGESGAELQAGWVIGDPGAGRRGAVTLHRPTSGADAQSVVEALSSLLGELADRVAASVAAAGPS